MKSSSYLVILTLFKMVVGATLLFFGWDALQNSEGNKFLNIALTMCLSFSPAAFAKPLYNRFFSVNEKMTLLIAFLYSALCIFILKGVSFSNIVIFSIIYFSLWIAYFLIEAGLEKSFMEIAAGLSPDDSRKFSGLSTGVAQLATLAGPVLIAFLTWVNLFSVHYSLVALLLLSSLISGLCSKGLRVYKIHGDPKVNRTHVTSNNRYGFSEYLLILSLASIWPTLAVFNMVIPIVSDEYFGKSLNMAAILEVCFALSMAVTGFTLPTIIKRFKCADIISSSTIIILIALIGFSVSYASFLGVVATIAVTGFCYGVYRVEIRSLMAKKYDSMMAGSMVASANALSAPLVMLSAVLVCIEYDWQSEFIGAKLGGLSIVLPMMFMVSSLLFKKSIMDLNKRLKS